MGVWGHASKQQRPGAAFAPRVWGRREPRPFAAIVLASTWSAMVVGSAALASAAGALRARMRAMARHPCLIGACNLVMGAFGAVYSAAGHRRQQTPEPEATSVFRIVERPIEGCVVCASHRGISHGRRDAASTFMFEAWHHAGHATNHRSRDAPLCGMSATSARARLHRVAGCAATTPGKRKTPNRGGTSAGEVQLSGKLSRSTQRATLLPLPARLRQTAPAQHRQPAVVLCRGCGVAPKWR